MLDSQGTPTTKSPPFRAASVPLHRTRAVRSTARVRGWHAIFFARRPCPFPRLGSPRSRPTRIGSRPPCFHGAVLGITSVECGLLYSSSSLVFPSPVWESGERRVWLGLVFTCTCYIVVVLVLVLANSGLINPWNVESTDNRPMETRHKIKM